MIIYTNGIHTSENEANDQRLLLYKFFKMKTILNWNPSASYTSSLAESVWGRWFWWMKSTSPAKKLKSLIIAQLKSRKVVYLVGHSQGTIITMNALRLVPTEYYSRIKVFLFAPAVSFKITHDDLLIEYFINKDDLVLNMIPGNHLIQMFRRAKKKHWYRDAKGHAFIKCYLSKAMKFINIKKSLLFKLCKIKKNLL